MSRSQAQNLLAYMTGNALITGIHIPSEKTKGRKIIPENIKYSNKVPTISTKRHF